MEARRFTKDGRTVTTRVPAAATRMLAEGFKEVKADQPAETKPAPVKRVEKPEPARPDEPTT